MEDKAPIMWEAMHVLATGDKKRDKEFNQAQLYSFTKTYTSIKQKSKKNIYIKK